MSPTTFDDTSGDEQNHGKVKDGNVWHDKLRAIRWDAAEGNWLVSTSEGFLRVDEHFCQKPVLLDKKQSPKISPMGVNVFESDGKGGWLIGSFSGMFRWNPEKNLIVDYFTGKANQGKSMIPISSFWSAVIPRTSLEEKK